MKIEIESAAVTHYRFIAQNQPYSLAMVTVEKNSHESKLLIKDLLNALTFEDRKYLINLLQFGADIKDEGIGE